MFRMLAGSPDVRPGFSEDRQMPRNYRGLESIQLKQGGKPSERQDRAGGHHRAGSSRQPHLPGGDDFPGVEAHANLISGLLNATELYKPD